MAGQAMKLSILIGADASGAKAGSAEAEAALGTVRKAANDAGVSINQLISETTGLNRAFASVDTRSADLAAYGAQMDALRARFNPMFATINRYKTEVLAIRDAHRLGAISSTEMTNAISRERTATLASIDAIKGRNTALKNAPANNNVQGFQTANIAAQFQDIAVTSAMGMNPLQIALQQGTQLSSVFVGMQNPIRGVGMALMQLVSPMSLLTIGAIALGAAALQYFFSSETEAKKLDEILDRHAENIRNVKDAYGDAAEGLKEYISESRTALLANLAANEVDARAAVLSAAQDAYSNITGRASAEFEGPIESYKAFAIAAEDLRKSIAAGNPDILAFRDAISQIAIDPAASESQKTLALELRNIDAEAIKIARSLPKVAEAMATLQGASQRGFLVGDDRQRQAAAEAITDAYLRQKEAIDEIYKSGVTTRGVMVTNAEQLLKLEQALTEEYNKQRTAITSRGFQITDKQALIDREKALTETYLRQQAVIKQTKEAHAAYEAQQLQAAARSPQEKAVAARASASAQVIPGEDAGVRAQRIELAGKQALANAERELARAQDDRLRSVEASVDAQQFELSIAGKTVVEQQRLRMEYQQIAELKEQAARTNTQVDAQEVELIKQKSAEYAKLASAIAGQNALKSQTDDIDKLRLEISLVGASADIRARSLAAYEAEKQIRDQGIASISAEADAIRANAQVRADLQMQLERQQAAYQSVQQAGSTMIDQLTVGTGTLKDRLKSMAETLLTTFQQLAVANPLKNMLLGTNLPTLGDLFSGKSASPIGATTTAAMTVTAGTVMINGVPMTGLPTPTALPSVTAAANQNVVNAVRPDVVSGAVVNAPAAQNLAGVVANTGVTKTGLPLSTITSQNGLTAQVNSQYAGNFQGFVSELQGTGYDINSLGGYNYRNIRGTNTLSNHAFGNAIDVNPATNPDGKSLVTDMPPNVSQMASKYGLEWGGDWQSKKDAMHFEVADGAKPMAFDKTNQSLEKLSQTTASTTNNISSLGTSSDKLGSTLTDVLGKSGAPAGAGANLFPPAPAAPVTAAVPPESLFSGIFSGLGKMLQSLTSGIGSIFKTIFGGLFADGAAFTGGNVTAFANGGVVGGPTMFAMSGGRAGLMGEDGPEAIMPLERGSGGKLGVRASIPRGSRQGNELRVRYENNSTVNVYGTGDKELLAQAQAGVKMQIEDSETRIRNSMPNMINDYRQNQWARNSG